MVSYIIELIFLLLTIGSARFQAWWFDVKQRHISHFIWACCYCFFAGVVTGAFDIGGTEPYWNSTGRHYNYVSFHDWVASVKWGLFFVLISQRFVFFSPLLNYWRIPRRAFFYISAGKGGSFWDDVLGAWYPFAYFVNLAGYITLQFFI